MDTHHRVGEPEGEEETSYKLGEPSLQGTSRLSSKWRRPICVLSLRPNLQVIQDSQTYR